MSEPMISPSDADEPNDPAVRFAELCEEQCDVLTVEQAADHLGRGGVRWAVDRELWQQPHGLVVVRHNGPLTTDQLRWLAVLAAPPGTALAGPTASELDGLKGFGEDLIHVVIPYGATRHVVPGVKVHWSSKLGPSHVHPLHKPPRTRLPRSMLDMASWARTDDAAVARLAAGVQQRLVSVPQLEQAAAARGRFKRSGLVRETLSDLAGGSHSLPEVEFIRIVRRRGLPEPTRQQVVQLPGGRRILDAEWTDFGVGAEVHGIPHMWVQRWDDDLDRISELTANGRRILQFTSYAVRHRPDRVGDRLEQALRTAGWRPPSSRS